MAPKTILITGCSAGGIGDALAQEFHRKGLRVFATARNLSKIEHLKIMGLDTIPLDVTDDNSINQAVKSVKEATGGTLDFLFHNSGAGYNMPLLDTEIEVAKKLFNLNVFAVIAVTQSFAPLLIAAKGTILTVGSVAGKGPLAWQGYYNASKAAVNLLTDQLRIELKPFGVNSINVVTGGVKSKFFDNLPPTTLPDGSLYAPWKKELETAMRGKDLIDSSMPVEKYAEQVVKNALKRKPNVYQWVGSSTLTIWLLSTFFWHTIWDLLIPISFKFPDWTKGSKVNTK